MEHILLSTNYPNLYGLGLYNLDIEMATKTRLMMIKIYKMNQFLSCRKMDTIR
jgi:hypothetical protein